MKIRLLVFGLLLPFLGIAQLPIKLKYDSLQYSIDSSTVLILSGRTSSVWDLKHDKYAIEPTKNKLINFPQSNNYLEFVVKTGKLNIHVIDPNFSASAYGNANSCYVSYQDASTYPILDCNGVLITTQEHHTLPDTLVPGSFDWSVFRIEKLSTGIYNITSYAEGYMLHKIDDSWEYVPGFYCSGVIDVNKKEWIIKPMYKTCFQVNNFLFCTRVTEKKSAFDLQNEVPEVQYDYLYDIYALNGNQVTLLKAKVDSVEDDLLARVLGVDKVYPVDNLPYYITEQDHKKGLVRFDFFEDSPAATDFKSQQLLPPVYDFVHFSAMGHNVISFRGGDDACMELYHIAHLPVGTDSLLVLIRGNDYVSFNQTKYDYRYEYYFSNWSTTVVTTDLENTVDADTMEIGEWERNQFLEKPMFGLRYLPDSMLLVQYFSMDEQSDMPYMSYLGEDSVIINEDGIPVLVFPPGKPGFSRSGVYDLKQHDWLLEPEHAFVHRGKSTYITKTPVSIGPEGTTYRYRIYDHLGQLLHADKTRDFFTNDLLNYKYAIAFCDADSVFPAPGGFDHHSQIKSAAFPLYVKSGDQLGIYWPNENFNNKAEEGLYDFVHYNPSASFCFFLKQDSLYLKTAYDTLAVSASQGKLIYQCYDVYDDTVDFFRLMAIEASDTVFIGNLAEKDAPLTTASIEIENGFLLVNDHTVYSHSDCIECFDEQGDFYSEIIDFESENSSVWKKEENSWVRISPYYASIHKLSNGWYIASSGYYRHYVNKDGKDLVDRELEERYFLLDANFKAIPYLDYFDFPHIEDLGFGIKIKLDNARYFFMTYDGKAITNADWDHFEMENGKLKAMLFTTYMYDENGKLVYDEFGLPVELSTETVKYFKL